MVSSSDSILILTIRLQGYEFFSEQFFRRKKRECNVSLQGMKMKIGESQVNGYLLTRDIARNIAEQTTYPLEIFSTAPDTVFFTFDKRALKRMPVSRPTTLTAIHPADSVLNPPDSIRGKAYRQDIKQNGSTKRKGTK